MSDPKKAREKLSGAKRVVVKIGTNCLTDEDSKLEEKSIEKLADDIADLKEDGREVILVSSGAIGAGLGRLSFGEMPEDMKSLQAASTVGQGALMRRYSECFEEHGIHVAQILLTQEDLTAPSRFQNFKNTIRTLFKWSVLPIVNENDAVAVEEIRMGDNDPLSAFTASGAGADLLIMLTDVDGLHTGDPKEEESAEPIRTVEKITPEIEKLTEKSSESKFGGMYTKVQAAKIATDEGIPVVVADAEESNVLKKILAGEEIGTLFLAQK
ncbi:glutamate 5-kinase [candidate division MSBL1 archaeon SCGC-AAA259E19]|uniref:Glutamate 5-kinase n=1 Tax=candidate division MSBL1 archaeon SCGC-AAA259E19 TaxID=1698264 RepID=A0A133UNR4_9EURY|nr:glutamate 5-kinase [candidate division MSBL1 archaeon SCGC-AAA259E19]